MAAIFFQQYIFKVVHLEIVQGSLLNTLIPNKLLQHSMSQELAKPPGLNLNNKFQNQNVIRVKCQKK